MNQTVFSVCACAFRLVGGGNAEVSSPAGSRLCDNLFAHARDSEEKLGIRIRVDIFRVLDRSLPLYSRICMFADAAAYSL